MAITREEFEEQYARNSDKSLDQLRALGLRPERCDCGEEGCKGWRMMLAFPPPGHLYAEQQTEAKSNADLKLVEIPPPKPEWVRYKSTPQTYVVELVGCEPGDTGAFRVADFGEVTKYRCPIHGDIGIAALCFTYEQNGKTTVSPRFCVACLVDLAKRFCAHT